MLKNKIEQSAAKSCSRTFELRVLPFGKTSRAKLLNFISCHLSEVFPLTVGSGKTMAFENRHVGCKEREKLTAGVSGIRRGHFFAVRRSCG